MGPKRGPWVGGRMGKVISNFQKKKSTGVQNLAWKFPVLMFWLILKFGFSWLVSNFEINLGKHKLRWSKSCFPKFIPIIIKLNVKKTQFWYLNHVFPNIFTCYKNISSYLIYKTTYLARNLRDAWGKTKLLKYRFIIHHN